MFIVSSSDKERPINETREGTLSSTTSCIKEYDTDRTVAHTESIFAFDVSSLASRDEENIAVVPTAKFGEEKLNAGNVSFSEICEFDGEGKLDVVPREQQEVSVYAINEEEEHSMTVSASTPNEEIPSSLPGKSASNNDECSPSQTCQPFFC